MAVESRIDADDEWFVGEDRVVSFTFVAGDTLTIESWTMVLQLFSRRAKDDAVPLLEVAVVGHAAIAADPEADPPVVAAPASAACTIDGDQTTALGAGVYQFVFRRTDTGLRTILGFGPVQLRSAVRA